MLLDAPKQIASGTYPVSDASMVERPGNKPRMENVSSVPPSDNAIRYRDNKYFALA
jgi:hypothetical protein